MNELVLRQRRLGRLEQKVHVVDEALGLALAAVEDLELALAHAVEDGATHLDRDALEGSDAAAVFLEEERPVALDLAPGEDEPDVGHRDPEPEATAKLPGPGGRRERESHQPREAEGSAPRAESMALPVRRPRRAGARKAFAPLGSRSLAPHASPPRPFPRATRPVGDPGARLEGMGGPDRGRLPG